MYIYICTYICILVSEQNMYMYTLTHTINLKYLKHTKKYRFIFYKTVLPFNFIKIYEHHLEKYFSFLV